MTSKAIDELLDLVYNVAKKKINQVLEWSKEFEINPNVEDKTRSEIAALVCMYDLIIPFSGAISELMCDLTNASASEITPWLRNNFHFRREDIYDMLGRWMRNDGHPKPFSAYDLNKSYEILQLAASRQDVNMIGWLLWQGVEVDRTDSSGRTALHVAAEKGDTRTVKFLLDKGASVFVMDSDGLSPYELAFDCQHFDTADLLNPQNFVNKCLLLNSIEGGNLAKLGYLLKYANLIHIAEAFRAAAKNGVLRIVEELLRDNRISTFIDEKGVDGKTPLVLAVEGNYPQVVERLLVGGATVDVDVFEMAKARRYEDVLAVFKKWFRNIYRKTLLEDNRLSYHLAEDDNDESFEREDSYG